MGASLLLLTTLFPGSCKKVACDSPMVRWEAEIHSQKLMGHLANNKQETLS